MKLRIRSVESKETLRVDTPSPSSLQDLRNAIAQKISAPPETIHLSLNRKDELLCSSSPQESLQSLGITSGDLIFYTLSPKGFSEQTLIQAPPTRTSLRIQRSNLGPEEVKTLKASENPESHNCSKAVGSLVSDRHPEDTIGFSGVVDETLIDPDGMDIDKSITVGKSCSVPRFLKKVFKEEADNAEGDCRILIIAIHAVMLESGFVCFDPTTEKTIDGFHLPAGWASTAFTVSFRYTLPDLVEADSGVVETVVLMFQNLGRFVSVYGSLTGKGSVSYRVCLNESRFVPSINFVWSNCDATDASKGKYGSSKSSHEREVFDFWKIVKDRLSLPLLVDLCEKTGLAPPACFMRLPTDLKLKTLELLPAVDIAKVGCVCSELKYLSSNDDLWREKFVEDFGGQCDMEGVQGGGHWKDTFVGYWVERKRMKNMRKTFIPWGRLPSVGIPNFPLRGAPNSYGFPGMIGGDYDRFPALRLPAPSGLGRIPHFPARRNFSPPCNLGGFNC